MLVSVSYMFKNIHYTFYLGHAIFCCQSSQCLSISVSTSIKFGGAIFVSILYNSKLILLVQDFACIFDSHVRNVIVTLGFTHAYSVMGLFKNTSFQAEMFDSVRLFNFLLNFSFVYK